MEGLPQQAIVDVAGASGIGHHRAQIAEWKVGQL